MRIIAGTILTVRSALAWHRGRCSRSQWGTDAAVGQRATRVYSIAGQAGQGGGTTPPKGSGGCRRQGSHASARFMLPTPLAPLDPHKTRALNTIYAPRKLAVRKNKTAQNRMLGNDLPVKPNLSPFHPLPAIGQKLERSKTKVIVFDLNKSEPLDRPVKFQNVLQPLTPLTVGFTRRNSSEQLRKPQQLLRENTYDVLEPVFVNAPSTKKEETPKETPLKYNTEIIQTGRPKMSPKTRFKKAALQVAKMTSMPENGKLLCLRERQTYNVCRNSDGSLCKLQELPQCPGQNLNKLSEIFQNLEMNGRHRDRIKKENSWF